MRSYPTQNPRTILVYVHLGQIVPIELLHHANLARTIMPMEDIYLITDAECDDFPGQVIPCLQVDWDVRFEKYLGKFPEISETNNGYWDVTLRRLLALELISKIVDSRTRIIHVESDVMVLLPIERISKALEHIRLPALPRLAENGIASFLYFPSAAHLADFCENILRTLDSTNVPLTDMKLLGLGLSLGWLQEIPSAPSSDIRENYQIIFDGAAIGQYLFGINPIHTGGILESGFQNPYFSVDLSTINWQIETDIQSNSPILVARFEGNSQIIANLHIHSKDLLPLPTRNSNRWIRALNEANGGDRQIEVRKIPRVDDSKISAKGKLRKARRIGLVAVVRIILGRAISRLR